MHDVVTIGEGDNFEDLATVITSFEGEVGPTAPVKISGNTIWITFSSDNRTSNHEGFHFRVTSVLFEDE